MNKSFNPNDCGNVLTLATMSKININDLVRQARERAKLLYLESFNLDSGLRIDLVTSSTRYGGLRYWFKCPKCQRKVGVLYRSINGSGCRICAKKV